MPGAGVAHDGGGEADPVAPVVVRDGAFGARAAEAGKVLDHERFRTAARGGDAGRGPGGAAADDHHVVPAQHGQFPGVLRKPGKVVRGAHADEHLAHVALGRRRFGGFSGQFHALRLRQRGRLLGRGGAHPGAQFHERQRPQQLFGRRAGHVGTAAQHVHPLHRGRPQRVQRQLGRPLPRAFERLPGVHRVGRNLKQHVRGPLLVGVVGKRSGRLVGRHPRGVAAVGHGQFERVFDDRECAARVRCAQRRTDHPRDHLCGGGRGQSHFRGGCGALTVIGRCAANVGTVPGRLAPDHHVPERVHAGRIGTELRAGQPGDQSAVGRVDDRLGHHGLSSGAIGHDDAGRVALGVAQQVGRVAAIQVLHAGSQQRLVERLLHVHRPRQGPARDGGMLIGRQQFDFTQQDSPEPFGLLGRNANVPRGGADGHGKDVTILARPGQAFPLAHLPPRLLVVADRHGYPVHVEAASHLVALFAAIDHHAGFLDRLRLAEVGRDRHVAVVLHALRRGAAPLTVGQPGGRVGIAVRVGRGRVGLVGELQGVPRGAGFQRILEEALCQRMLRLLARLEPETERSGHVVAQVGIRRGQKHARSRLRRRNGRRHGAGAATDDGHVDFVRNRDFPRRFVHRRLRRTCGGKKHPASHDGEPSDCCAVAHGDSSGLWIPTF